jgi:hypothetical protein
VSGFSLAFLTASANFLAIRSSLFFCGAGGVGEVLEHALARRGRVADDGARHGIDLQHRSAVGTSHFKRIVAQAHDNSASIKRGSNLRQFGLIRLVV